MMIRDIGVWQSPIRNPRFWVIPACFLVELPFILNMAPPGSPGFRKIYGTHLGHVLLGKLTGIDPSSQLIGWVFDFDKIVAYAVTMAAFVLLGRALSNFRTWRVAREAHMATMPRDSHLSREWARLNAHNLPWFVTAVAFVGAGLISLHYCVSGSEHYHGPSDTGLFNALAHLSEAWSGAWFSHAGYRLSYLTMAPVAYFILFATTTCGLIHVIRLVRLRGCLRRCGTSDLGSVDQRPSLNQLVERFVLVTVFPAGMLFILHHVLSYAWGLDQYRAEPTTGRFWILLVLYVEAIIAVTIGGIVPLLTALGTFLKGIKDSPVTSGLAWFSSILFAVAPVASTYWMPVQKSTLNRAIGDSSSLVIGGPEDNARDTEFFARVIRTLVEGDCLPIRHQKALQLCHGACGRAEYKAVTVLIAAAVYDGVSPADLAEAVTSPQPLEDLGYEQEDNERRWRVLSGLRRCYDVHQRELEGFWKRALEREESQQFRGLIEAVLASLGEDNCGSLACREELRGEAH